MENALRKEFVHKISIAGEKQAVFKAFCPVAEKEWIPGWGCEMIYSQTGIAEKNCIFTTRHDGLPEMVWVCSIYDPGKEVEYIRTTPGYFVTVINIKTKQVNEYTECTVRFMHTAISEIGEQYISNHFNKEQFIRQIDSWNSQISDYIKKHP